MRKRGMIYIFIKPNTSTANKDLDLSMDQTEDQNTTAGYKTTICALRPWLQPAPLSLLSLF